ncbi:inactive ubiquitin carboxyl-terminal hydrolase MINDY-4B [Musca vetustissima]|uniref:inactive ubiquitin carboxyl-terminal hydrolase MINDY-4B n=1 Tax=Musca vetustissima TaxID=27455 RepID=UPI002AB72436|nr:inactive ubiquitin carboxyl-terminal hydrolase MINDY-4B [Musca vetustissima]
MANQFKAQGAEAITPELAMELRQLVFGTSAIPMRAEWTQTPFTFGSPKEEYAYGLRSPRNATRGLLSVVQGFVVKNLLFGRKTTRAAAMADPLSPTSDMQRDALVSALIEILRIIADKDKVVMVLPSPDDECFVDHSALYFRDGVTEKLYIFTLNQNEELEFFIKRNYKIFTEEASPGTLLFLYSAVLTRTMGRVRSDLDSTKTVPLTMSNNEEGSLMIVTLLLTGRATPYIHNGVVNVGDENSYAVPQYGVLNRCAIGLMLWEGESGQSNLVARQPGSRLKTPNYPIWITLCAGHFGVMFNRNPDLLRNYHAESRFDLYYYSCSGREILMTIDNRSYNDQATGMLERQMSTTETTSLSGKPKDDKDEIKEELAVNTPLQKLIHTKWEEAQVRFHAQPTTLSYLFSTQQ